MILEKIVESTKKRYQKIMADKPLDEIIKQAKLISNDTGFPFLKAIKNQNLALICEIKKASPSKGIISNSFPYLEIANDYLIGGASAISVLTEPDYFLGADKYLIEIKKSSKLPILRKDFIISQYQIYESKVIGADAILLIVAILSMDMLKAYIKLAFELGLSCVVECHTIEEINQAIMAKAEIIGVNNRNLKTFKVDINTSLKLRKYVPPSIVYIAESGIKTQHDLQILKIANVDAALIGESLMLSENRIKKLKILKGELDEEN